MGNDWDICSFNSRTVPLICAFNSRSSNAALGLFILRVTSSMMFVALFSSSLLPPSLFPRWRLPLRRRTTPLIHRLSFALSPTCKKCRLVRCFKALATGTGPTVAGFRQLMTFDRRDLPCSLPRERGPMRSRVYKNRPIGAWGLLHTHLALPGQQCYKEKHLHDFEMLSLLKAGSSRIINVIHSLVYSSSITIVIPIKD